MNKKYPSLEKGFTLIEIMVAIAIVGILSGVALVSMSSYRAKARSAKLVGSLSSAISSMQSCWSFGGQVPAPSSDTNICSLNSSYGKWPNISSDSYSYSESNKADCPSITYFQPDSNEKSLLSFLIPTAHAAFGPAQCIIKSNWFLSASSATDNQKICCNQKMISCKIIGSSTTCDNTIN